MAQDNGVHPTVWMRSINYHTYEGKAQPPGSVYLAHEHIVETIEALKFGVKETAPPRAQRVAAPSAPVAPAAPSAATPAQTPEPVTEPTTEPPPAAPVDPPRTTTSTRSRKR